MIWIPYRELQRSAEALAEDELYEVFDEGMQALRGLVSGGKVHPTHEKFRRWLGWLRSYIASIEMEIQGLGHDPQPGPIQSAVYFLRNNISMAPVPPDWLGDDSFHLSQMSNLIRINPEFYARRFPAWVPLDLPLRG